MSEKKEFKTLAVGTASCGVVLTNGVTYSDLQAIVEHVLGHPVWTHELTDKGVLLRMSSAIREQLPDMPENDGEDDLNCELIAGRLLQTYGETVTLEKGSDERTEDPVTSAFRIIANSGATP